MPKECGLLFALCINPDMYLHRYSLKVSFGVFVWFSPCRIGKVVASHAAVARSSPAEVCTDLYYSKCAQGVPMRAGGATSQLDLPSLTPLSVAGCD